MTPRRTKIVATLGPASDSPEVLERMIRAGVDVVRLNFSHGTADDHASRMRRVREAAEKVGRDVAVMGDLQGPKIRIEQFREGKVILDDGQDFALDTAHDPKTGDASVVGCAYKALPDDVGAGDILLLNDGLIILEVKSVKGSRIECQVQVGGELSDRKGINKQGGGLSAAALTDKDREDIVTAARLEVDYLAVSFPREAMDIHEARQLMEEAGGRASMVAKIERTEAVEGIDEIMEASDAIMVARGDLAVEIGDAELPAVQKRLIHLAREANRVVITATQMMESMITQPAPTRAEVSDVANAVMDGTDAVMLSAETAAGRFPVKVVEAMDRVCRGAERQRFTQRSKHRMDQHFERIDEAVAMATMYTANHMDAKAIVALTESGYTALWMSRIRSGIPIYAMTRHETTRRRVCLYRGVYPVPFDIIGREPGKVLDDAAATLLYIGAVEEGDLVLFTKGDFDGIAGGTNGMKIMRVRKPVPDEPAEQMDYVDGAKGSDEG